MSNTAQQRAWRERNRAEKREPPNHGANGYINYGCKCQICTDANTDKSHRQYHKTHNKETL